MSALYWSVPDSTTLYPVLSPSPFTTSGPLCPARYPTTTATCEAYRLDVLSPYTATSPGFGT